jgi:hypothetical protein
MFQNFESAVMSHVLDQSLGLLPTAGYFMTICAISSRNAVLDTSVCGLSRWNKVITLRNICQRERIETKRMSIVDILWTSIDEAKQSITDVGRERTCERIFSTSYQ